MSLPIATTTISVLRRDPTLEQTTDGYDTPPPRTTAVSGLRACIGSPGGTESLTVGDRTVVTFTLNSDPFSYEPDDQIFDETTEETYELIWARTRPEYINYSYGLLRQVSGAA